MKFSEIYSANVKAVKAGLTAMWCGESPDGKQKRYADQLKRLIDTEIFNSEDYMPLVQSMERYEPCTDQDEEEIFRTIDRNLWGRKDSPYLHQVKAWKSLTDPTCRSMVVTTGTGSGKTECFMIPLVNELKQKNDGNGFHSVKAIFLYPLNALMEDQKERLQKLLENTGLTFAVYNGNLPDSRNEENRAQIDSEKGNYNIIIPTRSKLHRDGADIILTNPTMLEYMLIRDKDQKLFTPGTLRWIVVDEAHTFTGAAAAELALLLRRLNNAFETDLDQLHFAASSATIGNEEDRREQERQLKEFISKISNIDISKIDVISGKRIPYVPQDNSEFSRCKQKLTSSDCDYVKLSDLIDGNSILERLEKLDEYCGRDDDPLRAKVHFFYRAANNGIRVQLDQWEDEDNGLLKLQTTSPSDPNATPALEVLRCKCCGEYMAMGEYNEDSYSASTSSSEDMFDFSANDAGNQGKVFFGVVKANAPRVEGNEYVTIEGSKYRTCRQAIGDWVLAANTGLKCPHCGGSLTSKKATDNEDADVDESEIKATRLRVSAEFLSRLMAPSMLDCLRTSEGVTNPHKGQQYLSFVDSRQAAAQSTFKQNVEVEKNWVYGSVFHKLLECNKERDPAVINQLTQDLQSMAQRGIFGGDDFTKKQSKLNGLLATKTTLSWSDIFGHLKSEKETEALCKLFVNRTKGIELDENGNVNPVVRDRYIHAIMLSYLTKYPPFQASAETMGLFCSHYAKLDRIEEVPTEVSIFAAQHNVAISIDEWKDLLHIFLDRDPRSNESFYLKTNDPNVDLFNCSTRFGLKRPPHRTVRKPWLKEDCSNIGLIHRLIAKWIDPNGDLAQTIRNNRNDINTVIDALWKDLTQTTELLQPSRRINKNCSNQINGNITEREWEIDHDRPRDREKYPEEQLDPNGLQYRLNVADIGFELPERVYYCKIQERGGRINHIRPIYRTFKEYAPYESNGDLVQPFAEESWSELFPYINGVNGGQRVEYEQINTWLEQYRPKMKEYGLIGERGCFTDNIISVLSKPEVFLQAEHTAQVDKKTSKESQILFKNHGINILACSTTMEMGVDLGDLELVMMTSIPPHPANYKQRAGRSGRNDSARSVSITLCSSDAVGLRVLRGPMSSIIKRKVEMPFVDLNCPAIIQRHVNAFLYRKSGVFFSDNNRSSLNWQLIDVFSPYQFREDQRNVNGRTYRFKNYWRLEGIGADGRLVDMYPTDENPLGDDSTTRYQQFANWLLNDAIPTDISFLLNDTSESGRERILLDRCHDQWLEKKEDIQAELSYYGRLYKDAYNEALNSGNMEARGNGELDTSYGRLLIRKYNNILAQRLIEYLSTHRFTPNANMPVNIVTFEINAVGGNPWEHADNPSYPLQQALSQYAPGNTIVKENRILKVAGVDYFGKDSNQDPLHKFYTDGVNVVHSESRRTIPENDKELWPVNGLNALGMVRVKKFIPDINAQDSRMIEPAPYTRVSAQLVGAEDWGDGTAHLLNTRCNLNAGEAKILYYNEGLGHGYCLCPACGKMELETHAVANHYMESIPSGLTCVTENTDIPCHYSISRTNESGGPLRCIPKNNIYLRNVIIGDLIQTDFCEMKIQKTDGQPTSKQNDTSLLVTLGVVFCRVFTELIGKDRQSVDFVIVPNGNLCIFDTNPGGSGYSNQLDDSGIMEKVVNRSLDLLNAIDEKDALLDKFTVRYLNDLDVEAAKNWLRAEQESWHKLPEDVEQSIYRNAKWCGYHKLISDFKSAAESGNNGTLFVSNDFENWNYEAVAEDEDENKTWKVRMQKISVHYGIHKNSNLVIVAGPEAIPTPAKNMLRKIQWCDVKTIDSFMGDGFYPLAFVKGRFYFTNQEGTSSMNSNWARGNVFYIEDYQLQQDIQGLNLDYQQSMCNITIDGEENSKIKSTDLARTVIDLARNGGVDVADFFDYCHNNPEQEVEITYQDEHLKSVIGMIATIQFIDHLLDQMNRSNNFKVNFVNEEYYEASLEVTQPFKNIETSRRRNEILESLMEEWVMRRTNVGHDGVGNYWSNKTELAKTLPHWRVLSIVCGNRKVNIYPNGGIINEWYVDFNADPQRQYSMTDNSSTAIPLFRRSPILYTIEIAE